MLRTALLCLVVTALTGCAVLAQCRGNGGPWTPRDDTCPVEEFKATQASWDAICEEITRSPNADEWAGTYVASYMDTGEVAFRWAPSKGFAVIWTGCDPGLYDANCGSVVRLRDGLQLAPQLVQRRLWRGSMDERIVFVRWGQRRYVVQERRMAAFCDLAAGYTPYFYEDQDLFLVREGDEKRPVAEIPDVPAAYRHLVKRPIDARVIRASTPTRREVPDGTAIICAVAMDKGSRDGVRMDMTFAHEGEWGAGWVTVTSVSPDECTAEFQELVNPEEPAVTAPQFEMFGSRLAAGLKLSTRKH